MRTMYYTPFNQVVIDFHGGMSVYRNLYYLSKWWYLPCTARYWIFVECIQLLNGNCSMGNQYYRLTEFFTVHYMKLWRCKCHIFVPQTLYDQLTNIYILQRAHLTDAIMVKICIFHFISSVCDISRVNIHTHTQNGELMDVRVYRIVINNGTFFCLFDWNSNVNWGRNNSLRWNGGRVFAF